MGDADEKEVVAALTATLDSLQAQGAETRALRERVARLEERQRATAGTVDQIRTDVRGNRDQRLQHSAVLAAALALAGLAAGLAQC